MPERPPHAILGVSKDAAEAEIRTAYHKAAKKYHPDKQTNQQDKDKANVQFSQVNEAYESLMSQFHCHYGDEGEQDLADERPSRTRPKGKAGGQKVRKRSSTSRTSTNSEHVEKPSSFSMRHDKKQAVPQSPMAKTHRRSASASNSPAPNQTKRSIRGSVRTSNINSTSPGAIPKSPGSMAGKKSIRDSIRSKSPHASPHATRPRPRPIQRNSTAPSRHSSGPILGSSAGAAAGHRRSRSSLAANQPPPPRPPLDSPTPSTRKKQPHSPLHSPNSPTRRVGSMRGAHNRPSSGRNVLETNTRPSSGRNMMDASLSPRRVKKSPVHKRHSSFGSLNYNAAGAPPPPAPYLPGSPMGSSRSSGNLKTLKKSKAPPPPQSTMQRLSMKLGNRNERKAEKKARAEKLMQ
ncbi:MAG: hypothetical protein SGBAC_005033 [Bacillariaceae sp.]